MALQVTTKRFSRGVGRTLYAGVRAALHLLVRAVGVLATSAETAPANDELNSSIRGGVLNYRTGKLDDGTDPYGWYERD